VKSQREWKMNAHLKKTIEAIEGASDENRKIAMVLKNVSRDSSVLEVGCGYGEKMDLLQSLGFKNILGVEKNEEIVERDLESGKRVMSIGDFERECGDERFDMLVMSHVIEHFQWRELQDFLDSYLRHLRTGGFFLVVTPIFHPSFYDDFDHVKPYYPTGIKFLYGGEGRQFQLYSEHTLRLEDIYFRREPFEIRYSRAFYVQTRNRLPRLINILLALACKVSFGLIGRTTGWIGLYKKMNSSTP